MLKKVVTMGSSAGMTISPAELRDLGVKVGDQLLVTSRAGVLEVRRANPYQGKSRKELVELIERKTTRR